MFEISFRFKNGAKGTCLLKNPETEVQAAAVLLQSKEIYIKYKEREKTQMEEKIQDAIAQIRPFLQRDGGDIEFVELTEENIVKVRLQGHCAGCPGAQMTIKGVVERILKESYPEIQGVEAV